MNPGHSSRCSADALHRGSPSRSLLTNAMQPMLRPLHPRLVSSRFRRAPPRACGLVMRVSLDQRQGALHEEERGEGTYDKTIEGIDWLASPTALRLALRRPHNLLGESERAHCVRVFRGWAQERGWLDRWLRSQASSFCSRKWTSPPRCRRSPPPAGAFSAKRPGRHDVRYRARMVVKRKGSRAACRCCPARSCLTTTAFEMGETLDGARRLPMAVCSTHGAVKLCHPHCANFCVLGGGSCSA